MNYNKDLLSSDGYGCFKTMNQIYYTYNMLTSFNTDIDLSNVKTAIKKLREKLDKHTEIKESKDYKCRNYYDKMCDWCNLYMQYPTEDVAKRICNEVQKILEHLCKQGIVKKSGCNLKKNFYIEDWCPLIFFCSFLDTEQKSNAETLKNCFLGADKRLWKIVK